MAKRKIVEINEELCNGCSLCVDACHEGALQMINGKAKLMRDDYCDGLGDCLPECPTGAISIIEREAADYDDEAVKANMKKKHAAQGQHGGGCPGSMRRTFERSEAEPKPAKQHQAPLESTPSELRQWPVQLRLVSANASFLQGADLLIAADCTPFAYAGFHRDLLAGKVCIIACPKLDDYDEIVDKLGDILKSNDIKSITIARMEVPCCGGISAAVKQAMLNSGNVVPFDEKVITLDGNMG